MEVEIVSFSCWVWSYPEVDIPIVACSYDVDAVHVGTRRSWLNKTVSFELRGARVQIMRFLEREGRLWRKITKLPPKLKRRIS